MPLRSSVCNIWFDKSTQATVQEIVEDNDDFSSRTSNSNQIFENERISMTSEILSEKEQDTVRDAVLKTFGTFD